MSGTGSDDVDLPLERRTVLQSVGAASLLGVGIGTAGALQQTDTPPTVRGSVEQVSVTGAIPDATVTLYGPAGSVVREGTADDFGSVVFSDVDPNEGYQVTQTVDGEESDPSAAVRVLPVDYTPPADLYEQQELEEGFGYIEVRDGTTLACQVSFPDAAEWGEPPYPVIVDYSGYEPSTSFWDGIDSTFNDLGYAVAGVNKRGTACSGGKFDFGEPLHWTDGYDMVEALGAQDWADGVGLAGKSYPGYMQLYVAAMQPPSLAAIAPGHAVGDFYRDVGYPGGILNRTFAAVWAGQRDSESAPGGDRGNVDQRIDAGDEVCEANQNLRLQNPGLVETMEETPFYTGIFEDRSPWYLVGDIEVPTMLVVSWQDEQTASRVVRLAEQFDDETLLHIVGTNGDHGEYFGPHVFADIERFFSYHLKGEVPAEDPHQDASSFADARDAYTDEDPVTIYWEMSQDRQPSRTTSHADWPPESVESWDLYFQPDGRLDEEPPTEELPAGAGEASAYAFTAPGPLVQQIGRDDEGRMEWELESHTAYTAYVSPELASDRVCLGSGLVDLWVRSSVSDTDLQVTLSEVRPDGTEQFVQNGWLRASHRVENGERSKPRRPWHTHREADQEPLPAEGFANLRVELFPFGHLFRAGSRVKIAIDNPGGTRDRWGFDTVDEVATNEVGHTATMPSKVTLPLLTETDADLGDRPDCGTVRHQPCRPVDVDQLVGYADLALEGVAPAEMTVGPDDRLDMTVTVRNDGDARGWTRVELRVDDQTLASEPLAVDADTTGSLAFEDLDLITVLGPGEYEPIVWTAVGEQSVSLTVTTADDGTDDEHEDDATDADDEAIDAADGTDDADDDGPGFGVTATLGSLGGLGYLLHRRLVGTDDSG